jgi:lipoprotein-anchoring transpeptidase ErfK/SrfK
MPTDTPNDRARRWLPALVGPALAVLALVMLTPASTEARQTVAHAQIARTQQVAALLTPHAAHARPSFAARVVATVLASRPITGEQTELPIIGRHIDGRGRAWLLVRLPGRTLDNDPPSVGWIRASYTLRTMTPWHILVELAARRVIVYRYGRPLRVFAAVVGKPSTPTPPGDYFVEESVKLSAGAAGAPFALATSDRSDVLQEFEGGPGQIALHGVDNIGGDLGSAESHGCIRLATASITWLARHIGPGVPITIR